MAEAKPKEAVQHSEEDSDTDSLDTAPEESENPDEKVLITPFSNIARAKDYYNAANCLRRDIARGLKPHPLAPLQTPIPTPLCFYKGMLRHTAGLEEDEKKIYCDTTVAIRSGKNKSSDGPDWLSEIVNPPVNGPKLPKAAERKMVNEFFLEIALRDLYGLCHIDRDIPPFVPGVTRRANEFLSMQVDNDDLWEALAELQDSVRFGLQNALRREEGKGLVYVPPRSTPASPLCFFRGRICKTEKLTSLEKKAYVEDLAQIRSGMYDWDHLVITVANELAVHYPEESSNFEEGMSRVETPLPGQIPLRTTAEMILTSRNVLCLKIDPAFQVPIYLWRFLNRRFKDKALRGAAFCLREAVESGVKVRRGRIKSHEVPDFFFPFPLVFHEGLIRKTVRLTERERLDWKEDMVSISVGQYDFKWLASKLEREERRQGRYWKKENLTPFWAPDSGDEESDPEQLTLGDLLDPVVVPTSPEPEDESTFRYIVTDRTGRHRRGPNAKSEAPNTKLTDPEPTPAPQPGTSISQPQTENSTDTSTTITVTAAVPGSDPLQ